MDGNPSDPLPYSGVDVINILMSWPPTYEEIVVPQQAHWMQGVLAGDEDCPRYVAACMWDNVVGHDREFMLEFKPEWVKPMDESSFRNKDEARKFRNAFEEKHVF